ncbi:hypothetical protein IGS67_06670 [Flavimobilis sp. GY10621]|uniref:DUF5808 domain-containing protein n=1 Tax=Flavimobilis rhizosphaerae TaxID=2775421 RepID=A0ABR9DQE5_9MICO|nr:hypothetical protein [Flavimobilis rhizosphaerae]MBD9699174.1 hypothetical protein [Flavimobilis rhizosphaerae]
MTDLNVQPAAPAGSRRAALAESRHLHAMAGHVPAAYTVVESDVVRLLDVDAKGRRPVDLGGLWFGLCVVVSVVVLVAYDALVGFG